MSLSVVGNQGKEAKKIKYLELQNTANKIDLKEEVIIFSLINI